MGGVPSGNGTQEALESREHWKKISQVGVGEVMGSKFQPCSRCLGENLGSNPGPATDWLWDLGPVLLSPDLMSSADTVGHPPAAIALSC